MQTVLLVVHLLVVVVLITLVIIQRSEGGGLGMGSSNSFASTRTQANALSRGTMIFGILFFAGSLGMAILSNYLSKPASLLSGPQQTGPQAPVSGNQQGGGLLDTLRSQGNSTAPQPPAESAAPQAPVAPQQTEPAPGQSQPAAPKTPAEQQSPAAPAPQPR